jgi:hypothetical protein
MATAPLVSRMVEGSGLFRFTVPVSPTASGDSDKPLPELKTALAPLPLKLHGCERQPAQPQASEMEMRIKTGRGIIVQELMSFQ